MRLITHNLLECNIRGVTKGFPLRIEATEREILVSEFDAEITKNTLRRIHWDCLKSAIIDLNLSMDEFKSLENLDNITDENILKILHHYLYEIDIVSGFLVCPETSRKFPINESIPNMLLHEDEI